MADVDEQDLRDDFKGLPLERRMGEEVVREMPTEPKGEPELWPWPLPWCGLEVKPERFLWCTGERRRGDGCEGSAVGERGLERGKGTAVGGGEPRAAVPLPEPVKPVLIESPKAACLGLNLSGGESGPPPSRPRSSSLMSSLVLLRVYSSSSSSEQGVVLLPSSSSSSSSSPLLSSSSSACLLRRNMG
jgi:hypothetical protein